MAEDIRATDTPPDTAGDAVSKLITECRRQEESCLYTSTSLYIWLRQARTLRRLFVTAPIVLGALATWSVLDQPEVVWLQWLTATFALLAGLFPAIYEALKLDTRIEDIARQAAVFKNLQDRFRQAAAISSKGLYEKFLASFEALMKQMESARENSITPPERCFKAAREKIRSGHYSFTADE